MQASRLGDLQLKLESDGFTNVTFVVVNHRGPHSQLKYPHLRENVAENIPVYQQDTKQPDVWTALNGKKDDFLIYDRCGRLVYHLGLPYTFLSFSYVEEAIQSTYCESKCGNCSYMAVEDEERCKNISKKPDENPTETIPPSGHHHLLPPHRHHGHRQHNREGDHRHQSPQNNRRHNRVTVHNREGHDNVEAAVPQQAVVEMPPPEKRL